MTHFGLLNQRLCQERKNLMVSITFSLYSRGSVLEKDTLSSGQYWFNPGRLVPT